MKSSEARVRLPLEMWIQDLSPRIRLYGRGFRCQYDSGVSLIVTGSADTDDIVKQIGESDHPKIRGAMGFPGSTHSTTEAFLLNMVEQTHVLVFDSTEDRWRVYGSFDNTDMDHQEMIDHASEIVNEWFAESLSARIAATEEDEP